MTEKIRDRTLDQNAKSMKESFKAGGKKGKVFKDDAKPGNVNAKAGEGSRRTRGRRGGMNKRGKNKKNAAGEGERPMPMPYLTKRARARAVKARTRKARGTSQNKW